MWPTNLLLIALVHSVPSPSSTPNHGAPRLEGKSSYISVEANEHNVRSRIDVYGRNFIMRAVGRDPKMGAGSHDGGVIFVEDHERFYRLTGIEIYLQKAGVSEWNWDKTHCQRLDLNEDVYASTCTQGETRFSYVASKSKGVLSFTGFCFIAEDKLCDYVLTSETGIALR